MLIATRRPVPKALQRFTVRCEAARRPGRSAVAPDRESAPPRCGYGACSKSGCNCKGFEGSGGTCANSGCGHAYSDHW